MQPKSLKNDIKSEHIYRLVVFNDVFQIFMHFCTHISMVFDRFLGLSWPLSWHENSKKFKTSGSKSVPEPLEFRSCLPCIFELNGVPLGYNLGPTWRPTRLQDAPETEKKGTKKGGKWRFMLVSAQGSGMTPKMTFQT